MKKFLAYTILGALLIAVCTVDGYAQKKRSATPHAPGEDIYKHYTGTIGTKKIVLDLRWGYQGGSNYGGSSYYELGDDKITNLIIGEPESFDHGVPMMGREEPEDNNFAKDPERNWEASAKWNFTITGNKLTGKWHSVGDKEQYDIDLTEDYSRSIALDVKVTDEKSVQTIPGTDKPQVRTSLIYVSPLPTTNTIDASLLQTSLLKVTGMAEKGVNDIAFLPAVYNRSFTAERLKGADSKPIDPSNGNFLKMAIIMPVYNDNGLLVLENSETDLSVGTRSSKCSYICVDFQQHKIYTPFELVILNQLILEPLLRFAFRKKYNLDAKKPLSTWLKTDEMPIAKQIYPLTYGLMFVYNSDELIDENKITMSNPMKQISLYIPYSNVRDILAPDFKKRMGL